MAITDKFDIRKKIIQYFDQKKREADFANPADFTLEGITKNLQRLNGPQLEAKIVETVLEKMSDEDSPEIIEKKEMTLTLYVPVEYSEDFKRAHTAFVTPSPGLTRSVGVLIISIVVALAIQSKFLFFSDYLGPAITGILLMAVFGTVIGEYAVNVASKLNNNLAAVTNFDKGAIALALLLGLVFAGGYAILSVYTQRILAPIEIVGAFGGGIAAAGVFYKLKPSASQGRPDGKIAS